VKIVGNIQVLKETDTALKIDTAIADTMRLQPKTTLDAIVLVPPPDAGPGIRKMTLIVTPLPEMAWGHLLRMSVTLKPSAGSLEKTVRALQKLRIFCRHIETINGVNLRKTRVYGPDRRTWEFTPNKVDDDLLIPSTLFILEVQDSGISEDVTKDDGNTVTLRKSLRQIVEANQCNVSCSTHEAVSNMEAQLKEHVGPLEVDWISPMSTLNRLAQRLEHSKRSDSPYRRFSQRMLVSKAADCLQIDLTSLRHLLWNLKGRVPYQTSFHPGTSLFAQGFADSDEQLMCWDFYEFQDDLVVQFDVTTPTAGLEHRWWEWIYSSINAANGNVLASASSSRIDGQWGILRTTVVFPFDERKDDIDKIVHCFRVLQGDRGHTEEFEKLTSNLLGDHAENKKIAEFWKENEPSLSSILQNVEVWDPGEGSPMRGYFHRFSPNPFYFTLPLDLDRYQRLYGHRFTTPQRSSDGVNARLKNRHQLARRIIERMYGNPRKGDPGENIAIVGAHRAGKTTVLNLVEDTLRQSNLKGKGSHLIIPVRLNAAVDPPHMFLLSLAKALDEILADFAQPESSTASPARRNTINKLSRGIAPLLLAPLQYLEVKGESLATLSPYVPSWVGSLGLGLLPHFYKFLKEARAVAEAEGAQGTEEREERSSDEHLLSHFGHLKESLQFLRAQLERAGPNVRIFVLVDEFSEASQWGQPQAFPILRYVIESREFSRIKWLFSASRPVSEATEYSPITNVLFEYNVGPLPLEESERMIDAFGASEWQRGVRNRGGHKEQKGLLQPVIMHQARLFLLAITSQLPYLLQVSCYHIYDRAVRTYVPLIGRTLCIRIILERVLPELSDYFAHQWKEIHPEARRVIRQSLRGFVDQREFLTNLEAWTDNADKMHSGFRKALERSGLRGEGSHSVAPLVACWVLTAEAE